MAACFSINKQPFRVAFVAMRFVYASEVNRTAEMPPTYQKSGEKFTSFQFKFFYAHRNRA